MKKVGEARSVVRPPATPDPEGLLPLQSTRKRPATSAGRAGPAVAHRSAPDSFERSQPKRFNIPS